MSQVHNVSIMVMIITGNVHTIANQRSSRSNRTWLHTKIITQMAATPPRESSIESKSFGFFLEVGETLGYVIKAPDACYAD